MGGAGIMLNLGLLLAAPPLTVSSGPEQKEYPAAQGSLCEMSGAVEPADLPAQQGD